MIHTACSQQLKIATAQLRSQHILRPHALRLESLSRATVQAYLLRHRSQKYLFGGPGYYAYFGLRLCALECTSLRPERAVDPVRRVGRRKMRFFVRSMESDRWSRHCD